MDFKKELKNLVLSVKENVKKGGGKITNEDIATRLGYNRSYFSTLMGPNGKVEKEHIDNFNAHFQKEIAGIIKPSRPGDELNRERAMIKVMYQRVAKQEALRLGITFEQALDLMDDDTMIAWRDLERQERKGKE